jgi:Uma2 family endonuclease
MTLEEWADLDGDVEGELVDGVLEEEEMPTLLHELAVAWLIRTLGAWVRRRGGYVAGSETKVAVGPRRGRKPDVVLFLRGSLPSVEEVLVRTAPHLVIEVVSPRPRDTRRDRIDKLSDYARAGIRYYWLLEPQLRVLEVLELADTARYQVALSAGRGRLRIPGCPGLTLSLDSLWAELDEAALNQARPRPRDGRRRVKSARAHRRV